jgi:hypothetical protein
MNGTKVISGTEIEVCSIRNPKKLIVQNYTKISFYESGKGIPA